MTVSKSSRNPWFIAAAALLAIFGVIHLLSSARILSPVHASDLQPRVILVLDVVWYNVAAMLFGAAIVLLLASGRPAWRSPVGWSIAAWCGGGALLFLGFNLVWFGNLTTVPNWAPFLVIGAVLLLALRRDAIGGAR